MKRRRTGIRPSDAAARIVGGRVLMPGLTDARWHMMFAPNTLANLELADPGLMYANAAAEAERTVLRGFTTVRDLGGSTFKLKARSTPARFRVRPLIAAGHSSRRPLEGLSREVLHACGPPVQGGDF